MLNCIPTVRINDVHIQAVNLNTSVPDPHTFYADPDPAILVNADLILTFLQIFQFRVIIQFDLLQKRQKLERFTFLYTYIRSGTVSRKLTPMLL